MVGVQFQRKFSVRFFNILLICGVGYIQDFIIVFKFFCSSHWCSVTYPVFGDRLFQTFLDPQFLFFCFELKFLIGRYLFQVEICLTSVLFGWIIDLFSVEFGLGMYFQEL